MSNFIICTFYTPSYKRYLPKWETHVKATGYDYTARELPDRGKWNLNDCLKPVFIRDMLVEYPDKNVAWVDIDGQVVKKPELFESINADMAGFPYELLPTERKFIESSYVYKKLWRDRLIWGGTLWFANNVTSLTLINLWIESCESDPNRYVGDQDNLNEVLDKYADEMGLRFYDLPVWYAFGREHSKKSDYIGYGKMDEAVIIHDFASRDARRHDKGMKSTWETRLGVNR